MRRIPAIGIARLYLSLLVFKTGLNSRGVVFSFPAIRTRYVQFIFQCCLLDAIFWLIDDLRGFGLLSKSTVISLGAIDGALILLCPHYARGI